MGYGMQLADESAVPKIDDTIITAADPTKTTEPGVGETPDQAANPGGAETDQEKKNAKQAAIGAGVGALGQALGITATLLGDSGKGSRGGYLPSASQGDVPFSSTEVKALDRAQLTPDQRASLALSILSSAGGGVR